MNYVQRHNEIILHVPNWRHFDGWRHNDVNNYHFYRFWAIYQHLRYCNSFNDTFGGNFALYPQGTNSKDTMAAISSSKLMLFWRVTS